MDSPEQGNTYCDLWDGTFNAMFHLANVVLGIGFSMPQNFERGFLCMKFFISFGLVLTLLWAFDVVICKSPSIVIWNTCFVIINSIHAIALIKKHFPTFLPSKLVTYYKTVFKPLKIQKKDFNVLIKGAKIETYIYGRHFCQEHLTPVDKSLYILINGMMTVRCDGFFLQAIQPNEFINSVEWKCHQYGQTFTTHQVSIEAVTDCTVLVLNETCLEKAFDSAPKMRFVLDCLVGEDVAKKLYAVSDVVNMSMANQRENQPSQNQKPGTKNFSEMKQKRNLDFRRTASMDAIHTGGKGQVRSHQWIKDANLKHFQTDEQVALVNFELDVPPGMDYLPHKVAIQVVDKGIMAEAQFLAQQRKYWPSGLL